MGCHIEFIICSTLVSSLAQACQEESVSLLHKLNGDEELGFFRTEPAMGKPEYLDITFVARHVETQRILELRLAKSSIKSIIHRTTHIKQDARTEDYHR
jgi:hypothetical protein